MQVPGCPCRLTPGTPVGYSRQSFYSKQQYLAQQNHDQLLDLDLVAAIRRDIPGLGSHKLYRLLEPILRLSGIKLGRDKLHSLLQANKLLVRSARTIPKTTNSNHWMKKYPNLIKDFEINTTESVWVCDLTYLCVGSGFNYLSLITDAHRNGDPVQTYCRVLPASISYCGRVCSSTEDGIVYKKKA